MLKQGSVADLKAGNVSRKHGHIVVAMHLYPHGLKKTLIDEYVGILAPSGELFKDFYHEKRANEREHNEAFERCRYERRFGVPGQGLVELKRLAESSRTRDVYLLCQCGSGEKCHRELLMMMAERWYGASISELRFRYDVFARRLLKPPPANLSFAESSTRGKRGLEWPLPLRD